MAAFDRLPRTRRLSLRVSALGGLAIIAAACASAGGKRTSRAGCDLPDRDSVFAIRGPVYRDCGVDRVARLTADTRPDFRPTAPRTACYSADLEFVVDSLGRVEARTARVVRSSDQGFAESLLATLTGWLYEPAVRDQHPVRQIVTAHRTMATAVVVVPKGAPMPSGPPTQRAPSC